MKTPVQKLDEELVRQRFPIASRVPGWYFRLFERSNGCWCVEGTDLWGRTVGDAGNDENRVLARCNAMALEIYKQVTLRMEPDDVDVDWERVEADLRRARATLPPGESFEDEIVWYEMHLSDESTFCLACACLADYGKTHPVSREFWLALRDAASRMGMHEQAKDYERRGGAG